MNEQNYYVTTPIYYVNDKPHIGHAYTTVLADVLARYHRLLEQPVFFLTGTDEHGQKVEKAAAAGGMTPQEQADGTVVRFQELWDRLDITNDAFIRTTDDAHKKVVQEVLQDLFDRDEIYRDEYNGWYCTPCERFFTEKDLTDNCCPECHREVEQITEANYFFRMGSYQEWLIQYIEDHPEFIQPDFRRNETLGFLRKPLNDLCISRPKSRLSWGIELPFDADFVTYVWFDALVNYISAIGYKKDDEQFNKWWPASCQLIGKDILTTHTVYWPTMLKAMGLPMPKSIFAHGWWMMGESKMSKSRGNVVNPMKLADQYGVDSFRYFLMAEMTLGQDANFTEENYIKRYNSDLANDLGNLLSRVVKMVGSYCEGRLPDPGADVLSGTAEQDLWHEVQRGVEEMSASIPNMRIDSGIGAVLASIRAVNRYLEVKQPWTLAKRGETEELARCLYMSAEVLRVASALLHPIMPEKMAALRTSLGLTETAPSLDLLRQFGSLRPGAAVMLEEGLFPRIQQEKKKNVKKETGEKNPKKKKKAVDAELGDGLISFDEFMKVELKAAKVLTAERVEGTEKLLSLSIDVGGEKRPLVAGLAQHYTPEELVGLTVLVVANLKPAKIRGCESQGMLLAAADGDKLRVVTVDAPSGSRVR